LGTLTLSNTAYTGNTTVSNGTLQLISATPTPLYTNSTVYLFTTPTTGTVNLAFTGTNRVAAL